MIADTSRLAYKDIQKDLGRLQALVLEAIRTSEGMSIGEITAKTGMEKCSVCGRIGELKKQGLIYMAEKRPDKLTRKLVKIWKERIPYPLEVKQMELV